MPPLFYTEMDSPLGRILLVATSQGLCGLYFHDQRHLPAVRAAWRRDDARFAVIRPWVQAYFSGRSTTATVPLDIDGGTPFQRAVWQALRQIPLGQTWTYAQLAVQIGRPAAVRAVGAAVGRNPLSIIVPCHRVIGRDGTLTGYAGGLERKRWLLDHESAIAARQASPLVPL